MSLDDLPRVNLAEGDDVPEGDFVDENGIVWTHIETAPEAVEDEDAGESA